MLRSTLGCGVTRGAVIAEDDHAPHQLRQRDLLQPPAAGSPYRNTE